jgi:hypothetical protein
MCIHLDELAVVQYTTLNAAPGQHDRPRQRQASVQVLLRRPI